MNERIKELKEQSMEWFPNQADPDTKIRLLNAEKFAELIVRQCIDKIETYHIPVGNSAAGEMACGMTYDALKEIRDEIKEHFGVEL
jgi:hypothetical protein